MITDQFINNIVKQIENTRGVKVLLMVESGSRTWGFESAESDWDIKFIYTRPNDWYLSLYNGWDQTIDYKSGFSKIECTGWILPKALKLLKSGNASAHEIIRSPILYYSYPEFLDEITKLSHQFFDPVPAAWHYNSLASGNLNKYVDTGGYFKLKQVLHVCRAALSSKYIVVLKEFPPMDISVLLDKGSVIGVPTDIVHSIRKLVRMKQGAQDMGLGYWEEFSPLTKWLKNEIMNTKDILLSGGFERPDISVKVLDEAFRRFCL